MHSDLQQLKREINQIVILVPSSFKIQFLWDYIHVLQEI